MRSENHSRSWNIFETIETFGLLCAVPAEMPLPEFLISSDWRYQRQGSDDNVSWAYLDTPTANYGAHTNGFYLFMPTTITRHD